MTALDLALPQLPAGIEYDRQNDKLVERIQACLAHEQAESFKENLERLAGFARGGAKVRIGLDFAPLSFGFAVLRADGSCWIVGGLLYHGAHDGGGNGGAPTYSVNVQPIVGWTLHT